MNLTKDLDRALLAKQLTENPIYIEAIGLIRYGIITKWENCPIRDTEGQHELKLMLKLLTDLERNINRVIDTGKLAEIEIERQKKMSIVNIFKRN
jgi:hypothetical protein